MTILHDVLVPRVLLRRPDAFGGIPVDDCLRGDFHYSDGAPNRLEPAEQTDRPRMLLPALTEAHCHLDKCHSVARFGAVGGNLDQAIAAQTEDKAHWTQDDLTRRMTRGLTELYAAGCTAVRSHIDWGMEEKPPLAWSILQELSVDHSLTVQSAALTGISQLADPAYCNATAKNIASTRGGVLGAFVLHHDADDIEAGLRNAFATADRYALPLDFHVDEGLGSYNGLEAICDAAIAAQFDGPILCGHAVSLIDREPDALARITDKLLKARIHICALPTTNLYLQGRKDGTPDRRGLTRLRELHAAGVPIIVASDNVADAFCPVGQHDPRAALHLAVLAAHLDPPFGNWLPAITLNAATGLGLDPPYIDDAPIEKLRLCDVPSTAAFASMQAPLIAIDRLAEAS
ncbi:MAG: amidohydrolase family protein [Roseobacter sp.]